MVEVKGGASKTGTAARNGLSAAEDLSRQAERMRKAVQDFIAGSGRPRATGFVAITAPGTLVPGAFSFARSD